MEVRKEKAVIAKNATTENGKVMIDAVCR